MNKYKRYIPIIAAILIALGERQGRASGQEQGGKKPDGKGRFHPV